MSRFEQLRGWHLEQKKKVSDYWDSLQQAAEMLRQGYSEYLEAPVDGWVDTRNKQRDYVSLANKVGYDYEDVSYHQLKGAESWLDFHVGVALDEAAYQFPKRRIYVHLFMKKEGGSYFVKCDAPFFSIRATNSANGPDFEEAYEKLFEAVRKELSYRP